MSIMKLEQNIPNLPERDQNFAQSLVDQSKKRQLSDKQMYWVEVLAEKAEPVKEVVAAPISALGIIELIRRNNNAKRPKLHFLIGDLEFKLTVAGSKARYPGTINVVSGQRWYGRIHADGRYELSSRIDQAEHDVVVKAMYEIAADPAKAAAEYGKKTGRCCFCYLPLTDARSLMVGYGKICAGHYRLPWDISELEKLVLIPDLTDKQAFG